MQRKRMEILKYVRGGLRLQDFVSVPQYEPQVRQMGRRPYKTFYSKVWRQLYDFWRGGDNHEPDTSTFHPQNTFF